MKLKRLEEVLKQKGITKKELAKRINISPKTLTNYIEGKTDARTVNIRKICIELEISCNYLLGFDGWCSINNFSTSISIKFAIFNKYFTSNS